MGLVREPLAEVLIVYGELDRPQLAQRRGEHRGGLDPGPRRTGGQPQCGHQGRFLLQWVLHFRQKTLQVAPIFPVR